MRLSIDPSEYKNFAYNTTILNERAIELVLAERFLNEFDSASTLELGAVTPYYWPARTHITADPFDDHPNVKIKTRAEEMDFTALNVLSISTVEHIGQIGGNPDDAFPVVMRILEQSKNCLVTFPVGGHLGLQNSIRSIQDKIKPLFYFKVRKPDSPTGYFWEIRTDGYNGKYPSLDFGWAESIIVLTKFQSIT